MISSEIVSPYSWSIVNRRGEEEAPRVSREGAAPKTKKRKLQLVLIQIHSRKASAGSRFIVNADHGRWAKEHEYESSFMTDSQVLVRIHDAYNIRIPHS